jgi:hypothetical protein
MMVLKNKKAILLLGVVLALTGTPEAKAEVQQSQIVKIEDKKGQLQAYYDDDSSSTTCCDAVVMLNVGTAMTVDAYSELAESIVQQSSSSSATTSIVAIIIDTNPDNIQKQDREKYVDLANIIANNIMDLIPSSCCKQQPKNGYFLGGHSAGGEGAVRALSSSTNTNSASLLFPVSGYIGLAPYQISEKDMSITVPSLLWGFSKTSCGVDTKQAARAAYTVSNPSSRIFYDVQTSNWRPLSGPHCSFADGGCTVLGVALCSGGDKYSWIHDAVGDTVNRFISAVISGGSFERDQFDIGRDDVKLFVNSQTVPAGKKKVDLLPTMG